MIHTPIKWFPLRLERKNQPRVREWTNTHAHRSTRIITTLLGFVVVVEWRVCSMFGCCSRNPVRLRCCSNQYLCASLFTVNKLLTLFFWWQSHLGFSRIALWDHALFLISCFFFGNNSREESQEEACQNFYRSHRPEIAVWGSPVFLSTTN